MEEKLAASAEWLTVVAMEKEARALTSQHHPLQLLCAVGKMISFLIEPLLPQSQRELAIGPHSPTIVVEP